MSTPYDLYTASASQTDFTITFPYLRVTDVKVYVNDVLVSWGFNGSTTVRLATPLTGGETVLIRRETATDTPFATFTDVLGPTNLNNQVLQLLYGVEDLRYTISNLNIDGSTSDVVPPAGAAGKMLLSQVDGVGFSWNAVDPSSIASLLNDVPDPSGLADNTFMVADSGSWTSLTLAGLQTLLGDGNTLPDPTDAGSRFVASTAAGDGFELRTAAQVQTALSLGAAAYRGTGVNPSQVILLEDDGSGGGRIPTGVDGSLLSGVAPSPESVRASRLASANITGVADLATITAGLAIEGSAPSWCSIFEAGGAGTGATGLTLSEGEYIIELEVFIRGSGATNAYARLDISPSPFVQLEGNTVYALQGGVSRVKTQITVAAGTSVNMQGFLRIGSGTATLAAGVGGDSPALTLFVTKVG